MVSFVLSATSIAILAIVTLGASWHAAKLGVRALVFVSRLLAAMFILSPRAYSAAKAEADLPARDLALDFDGDDFAATRFDAIVRDRLTRAWIAAQHPDHARMATILGRRLSRSRSSH